MNPSFKYITALFVFLLISSVGYGQITLTAGKEKTKKIELVSPLDLLYKIPQTNTVSTMKHRSVFDANKLPIFCKIEHKLSKSSKVNLRMRLGSLDYVNKLEGKN